jgi:hypothetical protein
MQLLQDVFIVEKLQVLNEGVNKDTMRIRGVFGRCNEKNNNGRIYPTTVLENQLRKVQPLIQERRLCGELDHPSNDTVKLSNASHLITKLEIKGNELIGEAEILKTPAGLTAKALIDGGVRIGISSRGMGTLSEDSKGNKIVNEDFRLITFDLVADPSTRGAFPTLAESTQSRFARESQSKLQKESNFVIMLKSRLNESYKPINEKQFGSSIGNFIRAVDPYAARRYAAYGNAGKAIGSAAIGAVGRFGSAAEGAVGRFGSAISNIGSAIRARLGKKKKEKPEKDEKEEPRSDMDERFAHTEYHTIGRILAEALDIISEAEIVKSTKRTEVAKTKEKRKDIPKKTVIQTKGSDSKHVATVTTKPKSGTVVSGGEEMSKKDFAKRLRATGHKFAKVTNPRSLKVESYGDPDEGVKQRKVSGDWPTSGPKNTFSGMPRGEKTYSGEYTGGKGKKWRGGPARVRVHLTSVTDTKTGKQTKLPSKEQRDKARRERQERLSSNVKKIAEGKDWDADLRRDIYDQTKQRQKERDKEMKEIKVRAASYKGRRAEQKEGKK